MMKVAPAPGTLLLGKYRVEREIGSGGMGVVVEATHVALEQHVAIKLLDAELSADPESLARFLREARIAAKLPSDHVARVTDVGQTEAGAPYIVMELLVGHDLEEERLRRGQLPVADAVDLVLQACQGVADAHAAGLVHRDLKPANLFVTRRPNRPPVVKVLDFGLSKEPPSSEQKSLTGDDRVFGTPQYMSPEQVYSAKNVDARSDQHALAMILYELLTGNPPYVAETVTQLIVVIATHAPPHARAARRDVPERLDAALVRALAKVPAARFPDLGAFADAIAPFGGPHAAHMAAAIRGVLGPQRPPSVRPSRPSSFPSDELVTAPLGLAVGGRAHAHSQAGLTSSVDFMRRSRRSQRIALGAIGAAVAAALVIVALVGSGGRGDAPEVTEGPSAAAALPPPPPPAAPSAPAISPAPEPSGSAPAPAASASASAPGKRTRPAGGSERSAPKPSASSVIGVFGERTR